MNQEPLLSISAFIELLNEQLKQYQARIVGEVTEKKVSARGHVYFTLKDKENEAILECVMWKGLYSLYGINLEVGMELIASGQANIYAPWGKLSFVANSIELVGEGALKKAYDKMKQKLLLEGLFAQERKHLLPKFPRKIGVITSKQGAVIHDFMSNLGKHGFQITFIDSRVEGQEALPFLFQALQTMKTKDVEAIVLMRGGGSIQSLAAFDAEVLVREVASSSIPIVAAIGHHKDVPLCALASDIMVSTPTAAANLLNENWEKASHTANNDYQRIIFSYREILSNAFSTIELKQSLIIDKFSSTLQVFSSTSSRMPEYLYRVAESIASSSEIISRDSRNIINSMSNVLVEQDSEINSIGKVKIVHSFSLSLNNIYEKIKEKERLISVYNPLRQLALGYSLIRGDKGNLVKSIKDVTIGEKLSLITVDGAITSLVEDVKENYNEETN